jgi:hypothetical protein
MDRFTAPPAKCPKSHEKSGPRRPDHSASDAAWASACVPAESLRCGCATAIATPVVRSLRHRISPLSPPREATRLRPLGTCAKQVGQAIAAKPNLISVGAVGLPLRDHHSLSGRATLPDCIGIAASQRPSAPASLSATGAPRVALEDEPAVTRFVRQRQR